jgi:hypothetical protein
METCFGKSNFNADIQQSMLRPYAKGFGRPCNPLLETWDGTDTDALPGWASTSTGRVHIKGMISDRYRYDTDRI